jgi:hypothetical protein
MSWHKIATLSSFLQGKNFQQSLIVANKSFSNTGFPFDVSWRHIAPYEPSSGQCRPITEKRKTVTISNMHNEQTNANLIDRLLYCSLFTAINNEQYNKL